MGVAVELLAGGRVEESTDGPVGVRAVAGEEWEGTNFAEHNLTPSLSLPPQSEPAGREQGRIRHHTMPKGWLEPQNGSEISRRTWRRRNYGWGGVTAASSLALRFVRTALEVSMDVMSGTMSASGVDG